MWFKDEIPNRITMLWEYMKQGRPESQPFDYSPESLIPLWDWYQTKIKQVPKTKKEMAREVSVMTQKNSMEFDVEVLDMVMFGRWFQYLAMKTLKKQNIMVFASIHDLNIAAMYCDKIILMKKGRIVQMGTPEKIITEKNMADIFEVRSQVRVNEITGKVQIYYLPDNEFCRK